MKILYILLIVLFTPFMIFGQENLFQNSGFEEFTECYDSIKKEGVTLNKYWGYPIGQDTFSINQCDTAWSIHLNAIESRNGNSVQYILTYFNDPRMGGLDSRTYLVTKLKKSLRKNGYYFFKMYLKCIYNNAVNFCLTNSQGIALSKTIPKPTVKEGVLGISPKLQNDKLIDTAWTQFSGCFRAEGDEQYAIIGNFKPKNNTLIKRIAEPKKDTTIPNAPDFVAGLIDKSLTGSYIVDDVELLELTLDFPSDTAICQGEILNLDVKNNLPATYKWQDGSTSSKFIITKTGTYKVIIEYTFGANKCIVEQIFNIKVLPKYEEKPDVDTVICQYKSALLSSGFGRRDDTIRWSDNSIKDTIRVTKNGIYTATISNNCGLFKETFNVNFKNCTIDIFVPNAFSPNGDSQNDTFAPYLHADFPITYYEFSVFNRWGSQVFYSKERDVSWDGTFRNQLLSDDIYIWYLVVKGQVGTKKIEKIESGDVMIFR
jgi:gliding motility-associated-like protein